jgi:hypothetical protein
MNRKIETNTPTLIGMIINPNKQFKYIKEQNIIIKPLVIIIIMVIIGNGLTSI